MKIYNPGETFNFKEELNKLKESKAELREFIKFYYDYFENLPPKEVCQKYCAEVLARLFRAGDALVYNNFIKNLKNENSKIEEIQIIEPIFHEDDYDEDEEHDDDYYEDEEEEDLGF